MPEIEDGNKLNLMINKEDLQKFKIIPSQLDLPENTGCYILVHKKTNNFYFNYATKLKSAINLTFRKLKEQKHPNIKLQECVNYNFYFNIYILSCDHTLEAINVINKLIQKYQNSNLLLNNKTFNTKKYTEFEVQTTAYNNLLNAGYNIRGEFRYWYGGINNNDKSAIFDIAIFDEENKLTLIIEVKRSDKTTSIRQAERYTDITGVKTIYVRGMDDAIKIVEIVEQIL